MAVVKVEWTKHAERAAHDDRYGIIPLAKYIDLRAFHTVEVEKDERGVVTKILVRGPLDNDHDVCYALVPRAGMAWVVKTVWKNAHTDTHSLKNSRHRYVGA